MKTYAPGSWEHAASVAGQVTMSLYSMGIESTPHSAIHPALVLIVLAVGWQRRGWLFNQLFPVHRTRRVHLEPQGNTVQVEDV